MDFGSVFLSVLRFRSLFPSCLVRMSFMRIRDESRTSKISNPWPFLEEDSMDFVKIPASPCHPHMDLPALPFGKPKLSQPLSGPGE